MERPPREPAAPRMKSTEPPVPVTWRPRIISAFTWPPRSISRAELMDTKRSMAGERSRPVGVVDGPEAHVGPLPEPAVEGGGADGVGGDVAAAVDRLAAPGDHPVFHELHHPVVEDAGVQAEVVLVAEGPEHRVGNGADAGLDRVAVADEPGDVPGDGPRGLVRLGGGERGPGGGSPAPRSRSGGRRCGGPSRGVGEGGVHLGDDAPGPLAHDVDEVAVEAGAEVGRRLEAGGAVTRGGHAQDGEVEVEALAEEVGHRPELAGHEADAPRPVARAGLRGDEEGDRARLVVQGGEVEAVEAGHDRLDLR